MIAFIFSLLVVEQLFQLFQFQMFQFSFHYSSGFSSRFRYQLDIESDRGLIGNHLEKGRFETGGDERRPSGSETASSGSLLSVCRVSPFN